MLFITKKEMNQVIIKVERKGKKEKPKKFKKPSKQRKVPVIKTGIYKKPTFVLQALLIGNVGFRIYKNLTATGTYTVRGTEITKQQIVDADQVESFVKSFAKDYFS